MEALTSLLQGALVKLESTADQGRRFGIVVVGHIPDIFPRWLVIGCLWSPVLYGQTLTLVAGVARWVV